MPVRTIGYYSAQVQQLILALPVGLQARYAHLTALMLQFGATLGIPMMTHEQLIAKVLADPVVKAEYDALAPEFELLRMMLQARQAAGLSQAEVAARMGTKASAVARLESALLNGKHSPSISTLRRYAKAVNRTLEVRMVA
jgi:DNA-binding XRE family transcriptional regulator